MEGNYRIINTDAIQKKIDELEDLKREWFAKGLMVEYECTEAAILAMQKIISQSILLEPKLKKAFDAGNAYATGSHNDFKQIHPDKETYISNLKLSI